MNGAESQLPAAPVMPRLLRGQISQRGVARCGHKKMRLSGLVLCCLFLGACASSGLRVRRMTELAPPGRPVCVQDGAGVLFKWPASASEVSPDFAGYNVYVSRSSLILAPPDSMIPPVALGKTHSFRLQPAEFGVSPLFVHIRTRDRNGAVSLPALPELSVPGKCAASGF